MRFSGSDKNTGQKSVLTFDHISLMSDMIICSCLAICRGLSDLVNGLNKHTVMNFSEYSASYCGEGALILT